MNDNENKKMDTENKKNNSELITKESISAVGALFSALAFFVLCTKDLFFGALGVAIHSFLIGVFGYCAYAVFLWLTVLSIAGLFGKKLIKKKALTIGIGISVAFALLALHTLQTTLIYGWGLEDYVAKCFASGTEFPKSALIGCLGGLLTYGVASLVSNIGAIVVFALLATFSGYLTVLFSKKSKEPKAERADKVKKEKKHKEKEQDSEIPVQPISQTSQTPAYGNVRMDQRPSVSLNAGSGFSPFAQNNVVGTTVANAGHTYEDSRKYLFGSTTPRDNYKRNLIFDPSANVNNLPAVDPVQSNVTSGYIPSYADAYAESVNNEEKYTPLKIVEESPYMQNEEYNQEAEESATSYISPAQSFSSAFSSPTSTPIEPIQETENENPYAQYLGRTEKEEFPSESFDNSFGVEEERTDFNLGSQEEFVRESYLDEPKQEESSDYKRHDYMNLFSTSNPNVFGRYDGATEEETRASILGEHETNVSEDTQDSYRDRANIFDEEPEQDPYTLRSDYGDPSIQIPEERTDRNTFETQRFIEDSRNSWTDIQPTQEERTNEFSRFDMPIDSGRGRFEEEIVQSRIPEPEPQPKPKKPHIPKPYKRMSLDDLDCRDIEPTANTEEIERTKETIIATLEDFKVSGASIASVTFGPTVTRYNVTIPRNISPKKIVALDQSIAINLYSEGVSIYPNYEDGVVSIEVPNKERQFVQLGCMLSGDSYVNAKSSSLMFAMGKDVANRKIYGDISKMIHLLVAGASGMGKSVFLGSLIISLIHRYSPEELRLILVDPKKTEFVLYNNLPHLMVNEIITDVNKTVQSLNWAIEEMNRRYGLFEEMTKTNTAYVVNLDQYNAHVDKTERLPKILIIIDELADLMLAAKKEMEEKIQNLTQKARAAGIHLIVATQRPSTDVITGVIKSNLPTRIAFGVATDVDSRVILDQTGAQKLLGKGDFLYTMQGINTPVRVQSAFISPEESHRVVNYIKENNEAYYDEAVTEYINKKSASTGDTSSRFDNNNVEPVYIEALRYVIAIGSASISMIQRKCSTGYNKAGKIIEWMEENNYISAFDGARARKVLITPEEFEKIYGSL